ncbi:hypothetical protein CC80DRAFT_528684 [Byssothecium circinans]|uniref:DUF7907 domain-containing protein n=1 Tax=Byssothecium circinans TaxID=147558 RepID=A0A6A5TEC0_9PLEO|nr:hypothetical protein CC80DRAFT_528684 [Byssothecium circinans]
MKLAIPTITLAFAALSKAQYVNQSAPFNLYLTSDDPSVNGSTLSACHVGAAIESLCVSDSNSTSKPDPIPPSTFYFNTSETIDAPAPGLGQPGILTYWLGASPDPIPSAVTFWLDPITNYALPLLYPGANDAQTLAFDEEGRLSVNGYVDYTVNPPNAGVYKAYHRWYSCPTYYVAYQYVNLVWGLGDAKPETPGCVAVSVKRVFV